MDQSLAEEPVPVWEDHFALLIFNCFFLFSYLVLLLILIYGAQVVLDPYQITCIVFFCLTFTVQILSQVLSYLYDERTTGSISESLYLRFQGMLSIAFSLYFLVIHIFTFRVQHSRTTIMAMLKMIMIQNQKVNNRITTNNASIRHSIQIDVDNIEKQKKSEQKKQSKFDDPTFLLKIMKVYVIYYITLIAALCILRYFSVLRVPTDKSKQQSVLEILIYALHGIKLINDAIMIVWFIMEFKLLKRLLFIYLKFLQQKKVISEEQQAYEISRQNIFIEIMIWTISTMQLYLFVIRNLVAPMAYTQIISGELRVESLAFIQHQQLVSNLLMYLTSLQFLAMYYYFANNNGGAANGKIPKRKSKEVEDSKTRLTKNQTMKFNEGDNLVEQLMLDGDGDNQETKRNSGGYSRVSKQLDQHEATSNFQLGTYGSEDISIRQQSGVNLRIPVPNNGNISAHRSNNSQDFHSMYKVNLENNEVVFDRFASGEVVLPSGREHYSSSIVSATSDNSLFFPEQEEGYDEDFSQPLNPYDKYRNSSYYRIQ